MTVAESTSVWIEPELEFGETSSKDKNNRCPASGRPIDKRKVLESQHLRGVAAALSLGQPRSAVGSENRSGSPLA